MRRRVRAGDKPRRMRKRIGAARRSRLRRTRRGRGISAARAARLLTELFQLGRSLEIALDPPRGRWRLRPDGGLDQTSAAPGTHGARSAR